MRHGCQISSACGGRRRPRDIDAVAGFLPALAAFGAKIAKGERPQGAIG
jgi:hypothetical protein